MKPTTEILENIRQNSQRNKDEVFTRLFRYLLRPDLYYVAYKRLYANDGAGTRGINDDTADGFSEKRVEKIIGTLADASYTPSPARRTYIPKRNGKMRPLGIPTFTDKLVQEALRMVLEAIYEPVFLNSSHGFRPNRSCHTALKSLKRSFSGARWFVEGDIKSFFDNIDHQILMALIGKKVKDTRISQLLYKFLKAGYLEDWQYHNTYSGTPQGGIISPLLANIYLHELDKLVEQTAAEFSKPVERKHTAEYQQIANKVWRLQARINKAVPEERVELLQELKAVRAIMMRTPCKSHTDKKLKYVRYADDFLIAVNGTKEEAMDFKKRIKQFLEDTLHLELSEEKTLITHSSEYARFLGYDIRVRRDDQIMPSGSKTRRTLSNNTELLVPLMDKIERFLLDKKVVYRNGDQLKPRKRGNLTRFSDIEILSTYNSELRGICNYYNLASNYYSLHYFAYLMEYSCLKTLAAKYQTSIGDIKRRFKDGQGKWCVSYDTKKGKRQMYFARYQDCRETKVPQDTVTNIGLGFWHASNSFEARLKSKECQLCGDTQSEMYEIHHVNKLKNLKGKSQWERIMISRKRKTIVVCQTCHKKVHNGTF